MPHNSGQSGNRSFGLTGAGKGSASRITDIKRYRENHADIDWSEPAAVPQPLKTLRELEEEEHAWRMGL